MLRRTTNWTKAPRCPRTNPNGQQCGWYAGENTNHPGWGPCRGHGGAQKTTEHIWKQAMDTAHEMNVTPGEALLWLVRTAAGRAAWADSITRQGLTQYTDAGGDLADIPQGLQSLLKTSRAERDLAARTAKAAVDAGLMDALRRRLDLEGALIADALGAALDELGLPHEDRMRALTAAQHRLLAEGEAAA